MPCAPCAGSASAGFDVSCGAAGGYEAAGERLGIQARSVAVAVHRLRADFRAMVREEVAAGLRDEGMVEEEMKALAAALGA